ncbi:MAG: hypothetical protein ACK5LJ_13930 [Paracoccus sp. (in: a-proteobacteria)]
MVQHITAENFSVTEHRLYLGGRILDGSAILFAHFDRRISSELLGLSLGVIVCVAFALYVLAPVPFVMLLAFAAFLGAGAYREIRRPYVLVLELYQMGKFEVRGFTLDEAVQAEALLDQLRFAGNRTVGGRAGVAG